MTLSTSDTDGLDGIFGEALEKYKRGAAKYGKFNPETDPRDLVREAEAEILDAINYLGMFILKMRARDDDHIASCRDCRKSPSGGSNPVRTYKVSL